MTNRDKLKRALQTGLVLAVPMGALYRLVWKRYSAPSLRRQAARLESITLPHATAIAFGSFAVSAAVDYVVREATKPDPDPQLEALRELDKARRLLEQEQATREFANRQSEFDRRMAWVESLREKREAAAVAVNDDPLPDLEESGRRLQAVLDRIRDRADARDQEEAAIAAMQQVAEFGAHIRQHGMPGPSPTEPDAVQLLRDPGETPEPNNRWLNGLIARVTGRDEPLPDNEEVAARERHSRG